MLIIFAIHIMKELYGMGNYSFLKEFAVFNAAFSLGLGAILVASPSLIKDDLPKDFRGNAARILYEISLFIFINIGLFFVSFFDGDNMQIIFMGLVLAVLIALMFEIPMFIFKISKVFDSSESVKEGREVVLKNDVSNVFKNIFICAMLLINFSLILFILISGLSVDFKLFKGNLFGLTDSFWGALLGAVITGGIAFLVFSLDKFNENNKRQKLIQNYGVLIRRVHEETREDFKVFLSAGKNDSVLPENYKEIIARLITRGKIFDLIEVNGLIKETEQAFHIIDYMITYKEAVQIIADNHKKYGNIFFKHHKEENNKSNVEWLEEYVANMENNIIEIK